jgi:hypothetical protein
MIDSSNVFKSLFLLNYISFRFLNRLEDLTTFLTFSFILRITESIGSSGVGVAVLCLAGREFPDTIGTVFVRGHLHFYMLRFVWMLMCNQFVCIPCS